MAPPQTGSQCSQCNVRADGKTKTTTHESVCLSVCLSHVCYSPVQWCGLLPALYVCVCVRVYVCVCVCVCLCSLPTLSSLLVQWSNPGVMWG